MREKVLDLFEMTTGGRCIFSVNKVGGVLKDIDDVMLKTIKVTMNDVAADLKIIRKTFMKDYTVEARLRGVGILTKEQAHNLGAAGPFARASGIKMDMRTTGYAAYKDLDMEIVTSEVGDSFARCEVRIGEIFQAIDLIRQCIAKIPAGEISTIVKGNPNGEYFMRLEQPRGEAVYYSKANGSKFLERMRVRTPTFANIPGLLETLKGADFADVPLLILTIDPCISCTER
jgi:ech hydrogenase subunit E